jgi:hypothetical protein
VLRTLYEGADGVHLCIAWALAFFHLVFEHVTVWKGVAESFIVMEQKLPPVPGEL